MDAPEWIASIETFAVEYVRDFQVALTKPTSSFLLDSGKKRKLARSIRFAVISAAIGLLSLQFVDEFRRPITWASFAYLALFWVVFALAVARVLPGGDERVDDEEKRRGNLRIDANHDVSAVLVSLGLSYVLAAVAALLLPVIADVPGWRISPVYTFFGVQFLILVTYLLFFAVQPRAVARGAYAVTYLVSGTVVLVAASVFALLALRLFLVLPRSPLMEIIDCDFEDPCEEVLCRSRFVCDEP